MVTLKKFKNGLVVGKFYPPHRGHKYLIDTAEEQCEHVYVIVCGKQEELIDPQLRGSWIREIHPDVSVLVINDTLPDDDSQLWAENTIRWLGFVPDAVFTSEDYGEPYAKAMGCVHVQVNKARDVVPISGTEIRKEFEQFLEPVVRAYFTRRVCIVGAESTGTTTIAKALAEHYKTVWVPEYGRTYWEGKMYSKDASNWDTSEFVHIANQQSKMEDMLARSANRVVICDTDPFATSIWHERYLDSSSPEVKKIAAGRKYDLYLITDVDIPFTQDGTRDGEHKRHWMHKRFEEELKIQRQQYAVLSGSHEERLKKAIYLIDGILK